MTIFISQVKKTYCNNQKTLKNMSRESFLHSTAIFSIKVEEKNRSSFFSSRNSSKYSSNSKYVDNRDIRMKKHKNITFQLILRKIFLADEPHVEST
jgi:hypothetical protein